MTSRFQQPCFGVRGSETGISPIHVHFDQTTVVGMEYGAEVLPIIHQPEYRFRRVASQNAVPELPMTGF